MFDLLTVSICFVLFLSNSIHRYHLCHLPSKTKSAEGFTGVSAGFTKSRLFHPVVGSLLSYPPARDRFKKSPMAYERNF